MRSSVRIGQRIPAAHLAYLDAAGDLRTVHTESYFAGCKALVIGVPGAFTPVCTHQHLPPFLEKAAQFRKGGYTKLVCLSAGDPYSTAVWATQIDPHRNLTFLSDGNLDFTRAAGFSSVETSLFLGERSQRYVMALTNAIVTGLRIEQSVLQVTCTGADEVLLD
ncbi:MAG: peroxiredoxin family protein [Hyphomonadaceae bacterium]